MATLILQKRNITNTSAPSSSELLIGELALNVMESSGSSAKLYTKSNDGTIIDLTTGIGASVCKSSIVGLTA